MRVWTRFRSWLNTAFRRSASEGEMDQELRSHIALYAEDLVRDGLRPSDAMRRAQLEFGGMANIKEECRDARHVNLIEAGIQDLRFGLRMLRKNSGFTAVAVVTLALGIGANTSVFSVVNGVLLNPLPYPHPEQIVAIHESKPNFPTGSISVPNFRDWKKYNRTLSKLAISRTYGFTLVDANHSERVPARLVTSEFFSVFGVKPILGRDFAPGEDEIGAAPVALISYSFWQRRFGGLRSVVGSRIKLDDRGYTVIGIVPANFDLATESFRSADLFVPVGQWNNDAISSRGAGLSFHGFGRLRPGVTIEQARADMASVTGALAHEYPEDDKGVGATLVPLREEMFGRVQPILLMLLGAVVFVLLIACVNVGNLLLARAGTRAREVAIRTAVGAGRGRILRQFLTETILLALAGGGLGLLLASWGTRTALALLPMNLPRVNEVSMDYRVMAFTFLVSLFAGVLFGLAPAFKASHLDLQSALKEGGRGASGVRHKAQSVFVMLELAMALVLLAGAGLMIRSLSALWSVSPGFEPAGVMGFDLSLPRSMASSAPEAIRARLREIESRFAAAPGVSAVALSWGALPMLGDDEALFWMKGQPKPASESDMNWALRYIVGPNYLKAMGIQLRRGRFFNEHDDNHSPLVAVIDEEFARKFFPEQDPLGKRLELQSDPAGEVEVVGIVAHVKQWGLDAADDKDKLHAELYEPLFQQEDAAFPKMVPDLNVMARYTSSPASAFKALLRANASIDNGQTIFGMDTMNHVISETMTSRRFSMILLCVFAGTALLLAIIGVYGVISYSVGQRTNELGVRMAMGASRSQILRLVLRQGMSLATVGIAVGVLAALGLTRLLSGLLYSVSAHDPVTLSAVAMVLGIAAGLACWIPARRAIRVDPMMALRYE